MDGADIYRVEEMSEDGTISMRVFDMYEKKADLVVKLSLGQFLNRWSLHSGKLPIVLPAPTLNAVANLYDDSVRSKAFLALLEYEGLQLQTDRSVRYVIQPHGIVASGPIAKGVLKLCPLTNLGSVSSCKTSLRKPDAIIVGVGSEHVTVTGQSKPFKLAKCEEFAYVPFWWVTTTHKEEDANMRLASVKVTNGVVIPVLQNTRALKAKDQLLMFKAKVDKKALQNVLKVSRDIDGGLPTAKKIKKT